MDKMSLLPIGTPLQMGKYRIDRYLSSGGFGNTYVITNVQFEEQFAMKEFFMKGINERNDDNTSISVSNIDNHVHFEQQREKFKKEARRLRKLNNRHIVHVHDLFDENGTTYYVMDLIDGQSVSSIMKQTGSPLSEQKALDIFHQVMDALEVVHRERIWHLDLKPGNIMLDKKGNIVVIDFGASKQLSANEGYTSTSSALCYTPGYAPSEQIDQNMERIGPWTDIYALGATLYNMVTGNQPPSVSEIFDGNAFQFPPSVSESTQQLIKWMMSPGRQNRPQSISELRNRLRGGQTDHIISIEDESTIYGDKQKEKNTVIKEKNTITPQKEKNKKTSNRWPKLIMAFAVALVCVFLLGTVMYKSCNNENQLTQNGIAKSNNTKDIIPESVLNDSILKKDSIVQKLLSEFTAYGSDEITTENNYKTKLGECKYTGPMDDRGATGLGIAEFHDGRLYIGHFSDGGVMQGEAFFRDGNGDSFEGTFSNNSFLNGKYTVRKDGSYFIGSFIDNKPLKGAWYDKNGKQVNGGSRHSSKSVQQSKKGNVKSGNDYKRKNIDRGALESPEPINDNKDKKLDIKKPNIKPKTTEKLKEEPQVEKNPW
jgi:serine/threonine protein kinase